MTVNIKHTGGVGVNMRFAVYQDGKAVAQITRNGNRGWRIYSQFYGHVLASATNSAEAKQKALTLEYPDASAVYEILCARVAEKRRAEKEAWCGPQLARLARELISGSNSARLDLEQLVAEIESYVWDRTDTRRKRQAACDAEFERTGQRVYVSDYGTTLYPDAPAIAERVAA
jgi:hypothetical protein